MGIAVLLYKTGLLLPTWECVSLCIKTHPDLEIIHQSSPKEVGTRLQWLLWDVPQAFRR